MNQAKPIHQLALVVLFLAVVISPAWAAKTVMIGGGLNLCTSDAPSNCLAGTKFSNNAFSQSQFDLTTGQLSTLKSALKKHPNYSSQALTKVIQLLEQPARFPKRTSLSESDLRVGLLKQIPNVFKQITIGQWQLVLDHLESIPTQKRFLQSSAPRNKEVTLNKTQDDFSVKALRLFIEQLNGDDIVIVTAGNTDPFKDVLWLIDVFDELDINAQWLPLDGTISQNIPSKLEEEQRNTECSKLDSFRADTTGRFNRSAIYPKLHEMLVEHCENPEENTELIDDADGVLFWGENPYTLMLALTDNSGNATKEWQQLKRKHNKGELVIAANGGAVHAFSSKTNRAGAIISGDSYSALLEGMEFILDKPLFSYPNAHLNGLLFDEPNNVAARVELGLFDDVVFDTQVSDRGNQGRLIALVTQVRPKFAIGIDSRTVAVIEHNDKQVHIEVTGEGGVNLFDNSNIEITTLVPVQSESIVMNYITPGDTATIKNGDLSIDFADWKFSSSHYGQSVVKGGSAFRSDNFFKTLYMLCTTGGKTATIKHVELGKGHQLKVKKQSRSASVNGSQNINGKNYGYCSFRGYELETKVLL